jgi:hypothetical protein
LRQAGRPASLRNGLLFCAGVADLDVKAGPELLPCAADYGQVLRRQLDGTDA